MQASPAEREAPSTAAFTWCRRESPAPAAQFPGSVAPRRRPLRAPPPALLSTFHVL